MIGPTTPVTFHDHGIDAECTPECWDVSTAPWTAEAEPRTTRLMHNHIAQSHDLAGVPGCEACAQIDPLMMIRKPYRAGGSEYAVYDI